MKKNQLKAGAVISFVNLLLGNLIPFIYTPIMLRILGQAEYGLYGIAKSVMGYIHLLNFGIGGAIVRYIAKYRAEGDVIKEEAVIGLFIKLYSVIAALILAAGMTASFKVDIFSRSMNSDEIYELSILIRLMTINMAVFMPFSVFSSIIIAHERFIFSKSVGVASTVLLPVIDIIMLINGKGAVGLVISTILVNFLIYSIYVCYAVKKLRIKPNFSYRLPGLLGEITRFSLYVFMASIVDTLYWSTDRLIIGWAIGTAATAIYNVGATFNGYVTSLSTAVSDILIPKLTGMVVNGASGEELTAIFIRIGRVQFIVISFIVSAFVCFGKQFIALWAGENYSQAYYVALLVMIPVTIPLLQNTGLNILYAMNKHKFRSIIYFFISVINVLLTFWWVEIYGIVGAAMATCLAYVLGNILIMNWYYWKRIGLNIPLFWLNIFKMSPVMIFMGFGGYFGVKRLYTSNWFSWLLLAIAYTILYFIMAYLFMMNSYEKGLITSPIKKIMGRLKSS